MASKAFLSMVLCGCSAPCLFADFSFDQSTKITGGMMAGMMKVAGAFSKQARQPMDSRIMVQGDRMAMVTGDSVNVIDLAKETMTSIDMQKKTYGVITFADMGRAMAKMSERMKQSDAKMDFKIDVKPTGATRMVSGMNAKEQILTLTMQTTDPKSGKTADMVMTTSMWLAPSISGYDEVKNFYMKMSQKMAWSPGASGMIGALAGQQPGAQKAFEESMKEMAKIDGIPVLQVMRMRGAAEGMPSEAEMAKAQADAQAAQQQQGPAPTAGDAAAGAAAGAASGRTGRIGAIAGGLGGFGGLGRRKKEEPAQQPQTQAQAPAQPPAAGATPPGTLMELTTESSGFSTAPVDSSKFEVPAGFKEVEHDMEKALK